MKRYIFLITILMSVISLGFAQGKKEDKKAQMRQDLLEFKMKYLAQEMELKDDQKEKFFALYPEMSKKLRDCFKESRHLEKELKNSKDSAEEDYKKVTEAKNEANAKATEIEKEYDSKFSEFLSQKQIFKMKEAEKEFRNKMEQMRHEKKVKSTKKK